MTADPVLRQQLTEQLEAEYATWEESRPSDGAPVFVVSVQDAIRFAQAWGDARVAEVRDERDLALAYLTEATRLDHDDHQAACEAAREWLRQRI